MNHDFASRKKGEEPGSTKKIPRFDSHEKSCLGQGGIMDYAQDTENDKSGWSTCSVEDFTIELNDNKTCLKLIDTENPPANPTMPSLTKDVCDLSKIYPGLNGVHYLNLNGNLFNFEESIKFNKFW